MDDKKQTGVPEDRTPTPEQQPPSPPGPGDVVVDFEKIDILDGESRKILLSWLSEGLNDVSKTAKTDDGRDFYIDDSNLKTIEVKCEDGIFVMPSYRICFKR